MALHKPNGIRLNVKVSYGYVKVVFANLPDETVFDYTHLKNNKTSGQ